MKKFNVVRPKRYTKDNQEKTAWLPVGTMTQFDNGNMILEMNDKDEQYNIFPLENKQNNYSQPEPKRDYSQPEPQNQDINISDIPF